MIKMQKTITGRNLKYMILIMGSFISASQTTHAKFDGFYVGGSLGYLQQNTSINAQQDPSDPRSDMHKSTVVKGSPVTELFVGWGKVFNDCYYGGLEGKIDKVIGKSKKIAEDTGFIYMSGRKGLGLGVLLRGGIFISKQNMIYAGIGIKSVSFEHNLFEKTDKIPSQTSKRTLNSFIEVGLESNSMGFKHMGIRVAYTFMPKGSNVYISRKFPSNHMFNERSLFKAGVTEHAIKVGMFYRL